MENESHPLPSRSERPVAPDPGHARREARGHDARKAEDHPVTVFSLAQRLAAVRSLELLKLPVGEPKNMAIESFPAADDLP